MQTTSPRLDPSVGSMMSVPQRPEQRELLAVRGSVTLFDVRLMLAIVLDRRGLRVAFRIGDPKEPRTVI